MSFLGRHFRNRFLCGFMFVYIYMFYERSRMVLHVTRRLLHQLLTSVLSSHVRFQILDSSYHFN